MARHMRSIDHLAAIEAVLRGENPEPYSDKAVILAHAREMNRIINQLTEQLRMAHAQLPLFKENEHGND